MEDYSENWSLQWYVENICLVPSSDDNIYQMGIKEIKAFI